MCVSVCDVCVCVMCVCVWTLVELPMISPGAAFGTTHDECTMQAMFAAGVDKHIEASRPFSEPKAANEE